MDNYLKLRQLIGESEKLVNNQTSQLCKVIGDILSEDNQQTMDKKIFDKIKKESYNFYQILAFAKKIKTPYKSIRQEFFDVMIPFVMGIKRFFDEKHGSSYVLDFRLTMINGHDLTTPEIFDNLDEMFAWVWAEYFKYGEIANENKLKENANYSEYKEKTDNPLPKFKFNSALIRDFKEELMPLVEPLLLT